MNGPLRRRATTATRPPSASTSASKAAFSAARHLRHAASLWNTPEGGSNLATSLTATRAARRFRPYAYAKLKQFRAIATRYDKTARNFLAAVYLAAVAILLTTHPSRSRAG